MTTSRNRVASLLAAAVMLGCFSVATSPTAAAAPACPLPRFGPGPQYRPAVDPADFSPRVDNPLFPLTPGRVLVYTGTKDGKPALDIVAPSTRTRVLNGVRARVVEDRLYLGGVLAERTADYYAQDRCGNVWYFGEDTAELDRRGHVVSTEGSWHAGTAGAQPGVIMQAQPQVGRRFRQEWLAGHAEDVYRALQLSARVTVPAGRFAHALRTGETTALEPDVVDNKFYVTGIGEVAEVAVKGPRERLVLVEVIR